MQDVDLISGSGRCPGEGNGNPLQYACLGNPMNRSEERRVGKECRSLGREDHLEKEVATHSSMLAWEIPWTEEPGGLQSQKS